MKYLIIIFAIIFASCGGSSKSSFQSSFENDIEDFKDAWEDARDRRNDQRENKVEKDMSSYVNENLGPGDKLEDFSCRVLKTYPNPLNLRCKSGSIIYALTLAEKWEGTLDLDRGDYITFGGIHSPTFSKTSSFKNKYDPNKPFFYIKKACLEDQCK